MTPARLHVPAGVNAWGESECMCKRRGCREVAQQIAVLAAVPRPACPCIADAPAPNFLDENWVSVLISIILSVSDVNHGVEG